MGFMAAASSLLAVAGTAASAIGAINQGEAGSANGAFQAQVARNNQVIASQYAANANATGEVQAYNRGLADRAKAAAVTAGLAASGMDINTGTSAAVREATDVAGLTDVETVRQQAALKAYGYNVEGTNYDAQAGLEKTEASQDQTAGFLSAGSAVFRGLTKDGGIMLAGSGYTGPSQYQGLFDSANEDFSPAEQRFLSDWSIPTPSDA